jgi:type IV pilus assembly protein PilW
MKVLYGIGSAEQTTQYVDASAVPNFAQVTTVKLAFLIEGNVGSSPIPSTATETFTLLGDTVVVSPSDSRLRHVFNMTVNLRNNTL